MNRIFILALGLVVLLATSSFAASPMKPGNWEISTQVDMEGLPFQMPAIKITHCYTQQEIDDPAKSTPKGDEKKKCETKDLKMTGNTVTWKVACEDGTKGSGEMTYSGGGTAYDGKMTMEEPKQGPVKMKFKGKKIGECK